MRSGLGQGGDTQCIVTCETVPAVPQKRKIGKANCELNPVDL